VASLVNGHTLCFFILAGPEHSFRVNRKRLYRLIETVEFQFRSAEKQKIRSILDETGSVSGTGVRGRLRGVRLLALAGEYNAAVDELMVLRRELAAGLSNPVIEGNHLHYPLYNIHLTNPDEDRFTFHITDLPEMSSHMLFLQNKESGEGMGMGVVVLDMVLNYGPGYVKYIGDKTTEVDFLKAWGRSFIIGMNAGIEGERFVRIKKDRMYRAVFSTAMPDVKGKLYAVMRSGYLVGILILERTDRFGARTAIYEKMLGGNGLIIGE
jgi:hypothetical protein